MITRDKNPNMDLTDTYDEDYAYLLEKPLEELPADPTIFLTNPENYNQGIDVAPASTASLPQTNCNMPQRNVEQSHVEREVTAIHDLSLQDVKRPHKKRKIDSKISINEESLKDDYHNYLRGNEVEDVTKMNKREKEISHSLIKNWNSELEQELKQIRANRRFTANRAHSRMYRLNKKGLLGSLEDNMVTLEKEVTAFQKNEIALEVENKSLKDEVDYYKGLITNIPALKEQFLNFYKNNSYPSLLHFHKILITNPALQQQKEAQSSLDEQQNNSNSISDSTMGSKNHF